MIDLWDTVPEPPTAPQAVRVLTDRTKPAYPDPAPELTAKVWEKIRAEREARKNPDPEDESEFEITVTQEAEEFDEPVSPLAGYVKLAHANGWEIVQLGHSRAFAKGKPFKSGANEGKPRPDKEIEQQWLYARKAGVGGFAISYTVENGKVQGSKTARIFNRERYADADFKALIKGQK